MKGGGGGGNVNTDMKAQGHLRPRDEKRAQFGGLTNGLVFSLSNGICGGFGARWRGVVYRLGIRRFGRQIKLDKPSEGEIRNSSP